MPQSTNDTLLFEDQPLFDVEAPIRSNLSEAIKFNPDTYANGLRVAKETGLPAHIVQDSVDEIERMNMVRQIDIPELAKKNPNTYDFLTNFDNTAIAYDDVPLLQRIEDTFKGLGEVSKRDFRIQGKGLLLSGTDQLATDVHGIVPMSALPPGMEMEQQQISEQIARDFGVHNDQDLERLKGEVSEKLIAEILQLQEEQGEFTPQDLNLLQEGVRGGVHSLIQQAPGFAAMVLSGGRAAPMLITMGGQTFTRSYAGGRAEGLTPDEATWYAGIDSFIEIGTEYFPAGYLEKILTGSSTSMSKQALKFLMAEMPGEQLATLGQTLNAVAFGLDEELAQADSVSEMLDIQLRRQAVTAISTVVAGGAQVAAAGGINKGLSALNIHLQENRLRTDVQQQNIDRMMQDVAGSKMVERDVSKLKDFIQTADGDNNTHVHMDAAQTSLFLQSKTPEEIAADPALQLLVDKVQESAESGADVQIPVAEFATTMVKSVDTYNQLRPHMTIDPELQTPFRAEQDRVEMEQYAQKVFDKANENASEYLEAQAIWEQVRDQLVDTGRVESRQAGLYAQLPAAWATVQAAQRGVSVREVFENMGFTVEGPMTGERKRLEDELTNVFYSRAKDGDQPAFMTLTDGGIREVLNNRLRRDRDPETGGMVETTDTVFVRMSIDDFIALTTTETYTERDILTEGPKTSNVGDYREVDGTRFDPAEVDQDQLYAVPQLGVTIMEDGTARVMSHEGRHRSALLKRDGGTTVPVAIQIYNYDEVQGDLGTLQLEGQYLEDRRARVSGGIPATYDNLTAIRNLVGDGSYDREGSLTVETQQDFGELELSEDVTVEETGETVTITESAQRMFDQVVKRRSVLEKLLECVNG